VNVLALRLGGPLQSWGTSSRLDVNRRTERFPTKSAVVGILAAALGRSRSESVTDLTVLRFGVRADRPGELLLDYHTVSSLFDDKGHYAPAAGRLPTAKGGFRSVDTSRQVTKRYYLSDACFVAGFEGELEILERLDEALRHPVYPLYLGRRCCPPDRPIRLGIWQGSLEEVLKSLPIQASPRRSHTTPVRYEMVVEDNDGDRELIDEVRSFDSVNRSYERRRVRHYDLETPASVSATGRDTDPMALLDEEV
jgi:CRISPR system Cascade subunit CasD